ncbi:MAG: glutamate decarboxylase [Clostridiales bacterium]
MWTIVYIATSQIKAQNLVEALQQEGFMVRLRTVGAIADGDAAHIEILVPRSEAEDAMEMMNLLWGEAIFKASK